MKGDPIPDSDHVSRYCNPSRVQGGQPLAAAFDVRTGEDYLSVNWLEFFRLPNQAQALSEVRAAFRRKPFDIKATGRFAVLNVGEARQAVKDAATIDLEVREWPDEPSDPSHSGIWGYTADDKMVSLTLRQLVRPDNVYPGDVP